jgi:hypothetical protein
MPIVDSARGRSRPGARGLEAGAYKLIHKPELLARVPMLLRIKHLHDRLIDLNRIR